MESWPRVSFGIIVLNGEPFTRYNLRSLYPFAHEIIVAEGASPHAAHAATPDGHSSDGTLETLRRFQIEEDPDRKVTIVTAEDEGHPSGFWPGEKDEQSGAYAKRATGDYLWQVDIDEFYRAEDMQRVLEMLDSDPSITAVTFPEIPFWGSFDVRCDGPYLRLSYSQFHRLFRWGPGYRMVTHRPPTVVDECGQDLRGLRWISAAEMQQKGIFLYHYTQIFVGHVRSKMTYYDTLIRKTNRAKRIRNIDAWLQTSFLSLRNPFRVHTVNTQASWLTPFVGEHPAEIEALKVDIRRGAAVAEMRSMDDVDRLLSSLTYRIRVKLWQMWANYIIQTEVLGRDLLRNRIAVGEFMNSMGRIVIGEQRIF